MDQNKHINIAETACTYDYSPVHWACGMDQGYSQRRGGSAFSQNLDYNVHYFLKQPKNKHEKCCRVRSILISALVLKCLLTQTPNLNSKLELTLT